ncbi:hypothetical protein AN920_10390, partial [Pseudomonas paraeruginosa]
DEVLQETSALNLAAGNFSCFFVYLVNLEDALGYIDANDGLGKAHDDLSRWATELQMYHGPLGLIRLEAGAGRM